MIRSADLNDGKTDSSGGKPALFESNTRVFRPGIIRDKSYLGNSAIRNYTTEPCHAKIFLEFVALIIRNRFFTYLKNYMKMTDKKRNYYTVPAAIKELEKIEIIQQADRNYRLNNAVTAKQKDILKAFNMTAANIKEEAIAINDQLVQIAARRLQHGSQNDND